MATDDTARTADTAMDQSGAPRPASLPGEDEDKLFDILTAAPPGRPASAGRMPLFRN
jgi:hypothetical protein